MSVNFKYFITRIAKKCQFSPKKNQLLLCLKAESENKYKSYPRLLNLMKKLFIPYKTQNTGVDTEISEYLKMHYELFFAYYFTKMFYFRKGGLKFENPLAKGKFDFSLTYIYHYNLKEVKVIKDIVKKYNIKSDSGELMDINKLLLRLVLFIVSSFSYMIEKVYGMGFTFQFSSMDSFLLENGEIEVNAKISGRQQ